MAWPPTLEALKSDAKIKEADTRDDEALQVQLDAAVAWYERVKAGVYQFAPDPESALPVPGADQELGIIRLAHRWHTRRRSPDMLVAAGELGTGRVPSFDPDIERLLRIGRFRPPVFA